MEPISDIEEMEEICHIIYECLTASKHGWTMPATRKYAVCEKNKYFLPSNPYYFTINQT